jgi:hypothetical protein
MGAKVRTIAFLKLLYLIQTLCRNSLFALCTSVLPLVYTWLFRLALHSRHVLCATIRRQPDVKQA